MGLSLRCAGERERITSEIEAMGNCFKDSGECGAWIAEASDQHLQGVASEVNGPLLEWVVTRLGTSGTPAHDLVSLLCLALRGIYALFGMIGRRTT